MNGTARAASGRPREALVTSAPGRGVDEDLVPLRDALNDLGVTVDVLDWDDRTADWSAVHLAVIRSTWDYTTRHREFLDWCDRCSAATRLVNDPRVIAWNTDKRYLRELASMGIRIVATRFIDPGSPVELPTDREIVVKPSVSAGSRDTVRYRADEHGAAVAQAEALLARSRTVMIQEYQHDVDVNGEVALLYFGEVFSHAVRKGPLLEPGRGAHRALFASEHITPAEPTAEQFDVADLLLARLGAVAALSGVERPLPYARIDLVRDNDGRAAILELELTEPSLFLDSSIGSERRFARVLAECVSGDRL